MTEETVTSLAALVGGHVLGDGSRRIAGVGDLRTAGPDRIGFVRDAHYRDAALATRAGALITYAALETPASQIVVDDVGVAFAKVALRFHPLPRAREHRVHPTAVVDPEAVLVAPVEVGPHVVIGKARIGAGTILMAGCTVGDGTVIGPDCAFYPRVTVYHGCRIGARVVVHAGTVIGSDGFGYAREDQRFLKVPQLGSIELGDDVEIGANCTLDRGAIGDTRIGARTKIDNLCHIAHNCSFGEDCAMAAGSFIAGSTRFGDRCVIAGHVVVAGHLTIVDDVRIGGASVLMKSVPKPGDYMGHPLLEKKRFARLYVLLRDDLLDLQAEFEELKKRLDPPADETDA